MVARLCSVFLPKSGPGSITMLSAAMPSARHRFACRSRNAMTSATASPYTGAGLATRGLPCMCMTTAAAPVSAATRRISGSWKPSMLLMISAPASTAALATEGLKVSTEMGSPSEWRTARMTGTTRAVSSSAETGSPGPAFSPPMSMMSAPSPAISAARSTAAFGSPYLPRSKNESGVTLRIPMTLTRSSESGPEGSRSCLDPASALDGFNLAVNAGQVQVLLVVELEAALDVQLGQPLAPFARDPGGGDHVPNPVLVGQQLGKLLHLTLHLEIRRTSQRVAQATHQPAQLDQPLLLGEVREVGRLRRAARRPIGSHRGDRGAVQLGVLRRALGRLLRQEHGVGARGDATEDQ